MVCGSALASYPLLISLLFIPFTMHLSKPDMVVLLQAALTIEYKSIEKPWEAHPSDRCFHWKYLLKHSMGTSIAFVGILGTVVSWHLSVMTVWFGYGGIIKVNKNASNFLLQSVWNGVLELVIDRTQDFHLHCKTTAIDPNSTHRSLATLKE